MKTVCKSNEKCYYPLYGRLKSVPWEMCVLVALCKKPSNHRWRGIFSKMCVVLEVTIPSRVDSHLAPSIPRTGSGFIMT